MAKTYYQGKVYKTDKKKEVGQKQPAGRQTPTGQIKTNTSSYAVWRREQNLKGQRTSNAMQGYYRDNIGTGVKSSPDVAKDILKRSQQASQTTQLTGGGIPKLSDQYVTPVILQAGEKVRNTTKAAREGREKIAAGAGTAAQKSAETAGRILNAVQNKTSVPTPQTAGRTTPAGAALGVRQQERIDRLLHGAASRNVLQGEGSSIQPIMNLQPRNINEAAGGQTAQEPGSVIDRLLKRNVLEGQQEKKQMPVPGGITPQPKTQAAGIPQNTFNPAEEILKRMGKEAQAEAPAGVAMPTPKQAARTGANYQAGPQMTPEQYRDQRMAEMEAGLAQQQKAQNTQLNGDMEELYSKAGGAQADVSGIREAGQRKIEQREQEQKKYLAWIENGDPMEMDMQDRENAAQYWTDQKEEWENKKATYVPQTRTRNYQLWLRTPEGEMRNRYQMMHDRTREGYKRENDLIRINNIIREHPEIIPTELRGQMDERLPYGLEGLISGKDPIGFTISGLDQVYNYNGQELSLIDIIAPSQFTGDGQQVFNAAINNADRHLEAIEKANQKWANVDRMEADMTSEMDTSYHPQPQTVLVSADGRPVTSTSQRAAGIVNNPNIKDERTVYQETSAREVYYYANEKNGSNESYASFMTPNQVSRFNAYYNAGQIEEAMAYYEALKEVYLNGCVAGYKEQKSREMVNRPGTGILYTIESVGDRLLGLPGEMVGTVGAIAGEWMNNENFRKLSNPDNPVWHNLRSVNVIQDQAARNLGYEMGKVFGEPGQKAGEFFGKALVSLANNGLAIFASGGNTAIVQLIMSSEAATSKFLECMQKDMDVTEAAILSVGDGVIEWFTEKYSLEQLLHPNVKEMFGDWKKLAKFMGKNFLAEASEEGASHMLNTVADQVTSMIFNHPDEITQQISDRKTELEAGGMNPTQAAKVARNEVMEKWWGDLVEEMALGGFSGLMMSGGRVAYEYAKEAVTGAAAKGNINARNAQKALNNVRGEASAESVKTQAKDKANSDLLYLGKMGMGMKEGTASKELGTKIVKTIMSGKTPSAFDIGRLMTGIAMESSENVRNEAMKATGRVITEKLIDNGMDRLDAEAMAETIGKAVTLGPNALNKKERAQLTGNEAAYNMYKALAVPEQLEGARTKAKGAALAKEVGKAVNEKTAEDKSRIAITDFIVRRPKNIRVGSGKVTAARKEAARYLADKDEFAMHGMDPRKAAASDVLLRGTSIAKLEGFEKGKAKVKLADGSTEVVELEDVATTSGEAAAMLAYMRTNPGMMTDNYASKALAELDAAGEKAGGNFADAAAAINYAAWRGKEIPYTGMDKEAAERLYNQAKADAQAAEERRYKGLANITPGKGKATFDGATYGEKNNNWSNKLKEKGIDGAKRKQMDFIGEYAKKSGMTVEFYEGDNQDEYGWEDEETGTLHINLNAKLERTYLTQFKDETTGEKKYRRETKLVDRNLLYALGHEETHFLQEHSKEMYKRYQELVLDELERGGMNIEERINQKIASYNYFLTQKELKKQKEAEEKGETYEPQEAKRMNIADAIYEIVADASDQVFTSSAMKDRMLQEDPELHNTVKNFVQKTVARIREAILDNYATYSREGGIIRALGTVDEMAKNWLGVYDEVIHDAYTAAKMQEKAPGTNVTVEQLSGFKMPEVKATAEKPVPVYKNAASVAEKPISNPYGRTTVTAAATDEEATGPVYPRNWSIADKAIGQMAEDQTEGKPFNPQDVKAADQVLQNAVQHPKKSFSFKDPVEMRDDGLIAVHNLSAQSLQSVLRMQGFPMPSIAVLANNKQWRDYGDISIFFGENALDFNEGTVYSGDAYTPTLGNAQVETADQALDVLRKQQPRKLYMANGGTTAMFKDFMKVRDVNDARRRAWADPEASWQQSKKTFYKEREWAQPALDMLKKHGRATATPDAMVFRIGTGLLYAAEEINGRNLSKEEKYAILQKNIDKAYDEQFLEHFDYGVDGNELYDKMLDFIDEAEKMTQNYGMLESKPNRVLPFSDVKAIMLPEEAADRETIRALKKAGVDKHNIYTYKTGDAADRQEVAAQIPRTVKGVSFSAADNPQGVNEGEQGDIRYALADKRTRDYLAGWAQWHIEDNDDAMNKILKKYGISLNDIPGGAMLAENRWDQYGISKADQNKLEMLQRDTDKWEERRMDAMGLDEEDLGAQYVKAWRSFDYGRMEEILMEKMAGTDGIIPFRAPHWYDNERHRMVANLIKEGNKEALNIAAAEMSPLVPKNAALIPMPDRNGKAGADTTALTDLIGQMTGRPVIKALEGVKRMSRKEAKDQGVNLTAEDLGFRQVADIPEGMIPIFIDNVVGSGVTAQAAHDAMGKGITLAYAKSTRSAIPGLKNAAATFIDPKQTYLIPLEDRFDMEKTGVKGTRYSFADKAYMDAVESGNTEEQQKLVDQAAKANGYTIKAWHGSDAKFSVFKPGQRGEMWFASTPETAYNREHMYDTYLKMNNPYEVTYYVGANGKFDPVDVTEKGRANGKDGAIVHFRIDPTIALKQADMIENLFPDMKADNDFGNSFTFLPDAKMRKSLMKDGETLAEFIRRGTEEDLYNWYTVYDPTQIKSAEPVTYDDDGNPIDLSERFNSGNKDIRYSIKDSSGRDVTLTEEEIEENKTKISNMQPVATIEGNKFQKNADRNFKEMALEYFDSIGNKAINKVFGEIELNEYGVEHLVAWLTSRRAGILEAIKPVLENGEIINISDNGDGHGFDSATIAAPIIYNEDPYYMAVVIKQDADKKNSYYMHDAIIAKIEEGLPPVNKSLSKQTLGSNPTIASILSTIPGYNGNSGKDVTSETEKNNVSMSIRQTDEGTFEDGEGNAVAEELPGGVITAYSIRTVDDTVNDKLIDALVIKGFSEKKVKKWVKDVRGIAKMIADDKQRLDFTALGGTMLKNNQEYVKSLDSSTLCAKRLLYQGIFNAIQKQLPNTPLMPDDLIKLTNMMKKRGMVTPCSICYVESRRRLLGKYASEWLKTYEGEYKPRIADLTTTDGLQALRESNDPAKRQAAQDFEDAMAAKGSANPKLVQLRSEYRGEIMDMTENQIRKVKEIGGLRAQSFSDFETVHLLDMMQAVMDMAARDLTSQAYTKVPAFAWVFGDTGIKINLSLIGEGTGLDENGNLVFSSTEGMDIEEAMRLRRRYSKNVGTILVGMNDEHIIAAMGDGRIDFIIPFHKSGWGKREMAMMIGMGTYKDYTRFQNERMIARDENGNPIRAKNGQGYKTIPNKQSKIKNLEPVGPNGYWDFQENGTWNSERYLELCAKEGRMPKFANFLVDNGDGTYSLPSDNSKRSQNIRNGYWKLLIDFKMYDNAGVGSPQMEVTPNFNMKEARKILNDYEGGADTLPTNEALVNDFVSEYKAEHKGRKSWSFADQYDSQRSYSNTEGPNLDVNQWLLTVPESSLQTEAEKALQKSFKKLKLDIELAQHRQVEAQNKIKQWQAIKNPDQDTKRKIEGYKIRLQNAIAAEKALEAQLVSATRREGFAGMMYYHQQQMEDHLQNKTMDEIIENVHKMEDAATALKDDIQQTTAELKDLEKSQGVQNIRSQISQSSVDKAAARIRKNYNSTINKQELMTDLAKIRLMIQNNAGENVITAEIEALAGKILQARKATVRNAALEYMRGMTLRLGDSALKEIYGSNSNLKEIRKMMAGSGIKVVRADGKGGSLDANWDELVSYVPALDHYNGYDTDNALDQAKAVSEYVMNAMQNQQRAGAEEFAGQMDDVIFDLLGEIAQIDTMVTTDPKANKLIEELQAYITDMAGRAGKANAKIAELSRKLDAMLASGQKAAAWSNSLKADIAQTVEYYNKTAKMAIDQAKVNKQNELIQQLKDKHTEEMVRANEEWRNLIERDKQARYQAEDNAALRRKMNTVVTRLAKLLSSPTNTKNIPEHMNGLAREIVETFVSADLADGKRKITNIDRQSLMNLQKKLDAWNMRDGRFNPADLKLAEEGVMIRAEEDLRIIYDAIQEWNGKYNGKNRLDTLQQMGKTLKRMQEALSELYSIIKAEQQIALGDRRVAIEDQAYKVQEGTGGKKYKEWTGKAGRAIAAMKRGIISGNMTPEYFFRMIGNEGLSELWEEYHRAENRNGLELARAQERIAEIAEKYGYNTWDLKKRVPVEFEKGGTVNMTLGQLMSLWATWNREQTLGPEMSEHLAKGGFYVEEMDPRDGLLGRQATDKQAHRVTKEDMAKVGEMLTEEQRNFVNDIVEFMSNDLSKLGNEASMKAYGIKMYKERYYFPFQMWDGIKAKKSNDSGSAASRDRAFHPSFSKSRMHGANNALVIGDFMQTAADHAVGMINYATMGLANETFQKVLNQNVKEGYGDTETKRNIRAILEEAYGMDAMRYLRELQDQLNGGAVATRKSLGDKAISLFRKNAVAGSLSVALQQPLSFIRAAMMIDPKYLAMGVTSEYWKGAYKELMEHSGVAVIKDMGRFDMGLGQSAREYLMPDAKENGIRKAWDTITDKATILPEWMDRMTWTRMWVAVKAEQHALHPDMDVKSDEFLDLCGTRFNEVMRRTQVYDSVLVKSANMRSDNYWIKSLTSFMAEPTLSANVLMDSVRMAVKGEKGGKAALAMAGATYVVSAVMQAAFKGLMGAGRNPDEDKTFLENLLYRFGNALISELDVFNLIPGYSDMVTLLKEGKLQDDAMGAVGKIITAGRTAIDMLLGKESKKGTYRDVEDGIGQLVQLFTNMPMKNLMRDGRAMYNFFTQPYAKRENSAAVMKYQAAEQFFNADNLIGVINKYLGEAGYRTTKSEYKARIKEAEAAGDYETAEALREFTGISASESEQNSNAYIQQQMKAGKMTPEEARAKVKEIYPDRTDESVWWTVDRMEYENATGKDAGSGKYYRLWDAMDNNKAEEIGTALAGMTGHGMKADSIKGEINNHYKAAYLAADNDGKRRIRDAMQKAYKKLGYTAEDANKVIDKWK